MTFQGWPPAAFAWFEGLEEDNSKPYWEANKASYERDVRGPLEALLEEVAAEFGEGKIFRPYRDVRFSKDKSPYKTNCYAVAWDGTDGYYVGVSADGLTAGTGYYQMATDQLERYRAAVDDAGTGSQLEALVAQVTGGGYRISEEELKTAPRGYPRDHERVGLLRRKSVVLFCDEPPGPTVHSRAALNLVTRTWRDGKPLNAWFEKHVGPSDQPEATR